MDNLLIISILLPSAFFLFSFIITAHTDWIEDGFEWLKSKVLKKERLKAKYYFLHHISGISADCPYIWSRRLYPISPNIQRLCIIISNYIEEKKYHVLEEIESDLDNELWLIKDILKKHINKSADDNVMKLVIVSVIEIDKGIGDYLNNRSAGNSSRRELEQNLAIYREAKEREKVRNYL